MKISSVIKHPCGHTSSIHLRWMLSAARTLFIFVTIATSFALPAASRAVDIFTAPSPIYQSTTDSRYTYFATSSPPQLWRLDRSSGLTESLLERPRYSDEIWDLATDGRFLYFVSANSMQTLWYLSRMPVAGGLAEVLAMSVRPIRQPRTDGAHVYWVTHSTRATDDSANHDGAVHRVAVGGGEITTLSSGLLLPSSERLDLELTSDHIYLITKVGLLRLPITGGLPVVAVAGSGFQTFAEGPANEIWVTAAVTTGTRFQAQVLRLNTESLSLQLMASVDSSLSPYVDAEVSEDGGHILLNVYTSVRLHWEYRRLFAIDLGLHPSTRVLYETSSALFLLGGDRGAAYIGVGALSRTGAVVIVRVATSPRVRGFVRR